jgi:hypothetical protein
MKPQDQRDVLTLCESAADAWTRGRYDLATEWMRLATEIIGTDTFLDTDTDATR